MSFTDDLVLSLFCKLCLYNAFTFTPLFWLLKIKIKTYDIYIHVYSFILFNVIKSTGQKSLLKIKLFSAIKLYVTWTSIGFIYFLEAFTVPSLATFQQRGQEILRGQFFFKKQQFDLDLVTWKSIGVISRNNHSLYS